MKQAKKWLIVATAVLLLAALVQPLNAHGGGTLVANETVEDLIVSVWFNPERPASNETLHVTVGLATGEDQRFVLDERIEIAIRRAADDEIVWQGVATTEASVSRLFYEADVTAVSRGDYQLSVLVVGKGEIAIPLTVTEPVINYRPLLIGAGLAILAAVFIVASRRTPQVAPPKPRAPRQAP